MYNSHVINPDFNLQLDCPRCPHSSTIQPHQPRRTSYQCQLLSLVATATLTLICICISCQVVNNPSFGPSRRQQRTGDKSFLTAQRELSHEMNAQMREKVY